LTGSRADIGAPIDVPAVRDEMGTPVTPGAGDVSISLDTQGKAFKIKKNEQ
jgi:hypothetical protein